VPGFSSKQPLPPAASPIRRGAFTLLALLTSLNGLSWIDRQIVPALAPLLIAELGINNAQIGLLYGYAFILCFILAGAVLGPVADRVNRPRLIAAGVGLWSIATAASGLANSFLQLAAARVLVGVGEATLTPAALAMLSDAFPQGWRARAAGIFAMGLPLGAGFSLVVAGLLAPRYGWRVCFFVFGAIGMVAAVGTARIRDYREPSAPAAGGGVNPIFRQIIAGTPALSLVILAAILLSFSAAGTIHGVTWLVRERGFDFRTATMLAGAMYAAGGATGNVVGGWLADWCQSRWRGGRLWSLAIMQGALVPVAIVFFTTTSGTAAFYAAWIGSSIRSTMWYGPVFAAAHDRVPPSSRATATAMIILLTNLIGVGPGAWLAGAIGDRWSLTTGQVIITWAGLLAVIPLAIAARYEARGSKAAASIGGR
jgi:MFS transporter, Spinster family, sphingosine-1-phosphate transporter